MMPIKKPQIKNPVVAYGVGKEVTTWSKEKSLRRKPTIVLYYFFSVRLTYKIMLLSKREKNRTVYVFTMKLVYIDLFQEWGWEVEKQKALHF